MQGTLLPQYPIEYRLCTETPGTAGLGTPTDVCLDILSGPPVTQGVPGPTHSPGEMLSALPWMTEKQPVMR